MKRRNFLKFAGGLTGTTLVGGGGFDYYAHHIEPAWIEVHAIALRLPRLEPAFNGYKIVQISDIHVDGIWMDRARLAGIVAQVNQQEPDVIVITGDFVTDASSPFEDVTVLRQLHARDGIFAVLGNHDHWSDADQVRAILKACSIHELKDALYTLHRGQAMLHLLGFEDLWQESDVILPLSSHTDRLKGLIDQLPASGPVVLLVHEPDFGDIAASMARIDLQLSGHSHAGQVRVPFHGVVEVPPLATRYPDGMYILGDMKLYTNRGLGMVAPRVRFNCRPEIAVFTCIAS